MIAPETDWRTRRLAVIDLETTGLDPAVHRVVEVAVLLIENWQPIGFAHCLVRPPGGIPEEATLVHGITNAEVANAPLFGDCVSAIVNAIGDAIPVGYNGRFDRAFLIAEWLRCCDPSCSPPAFLVGADRSTWLDVLVWARAHNPYAEGKGRHKLEAVAARIGAVAGTSHRALGDCETTAGVLAKLQALDMHTETYRNHVGPMPTRWDDLQLHQKRLAASDEARFLSWLADQPRLAPTEPAPAEGER